jgi:spermidine synthase
VTTQTATADNAGSSWRAGCDLFLISWLILFLELACIRWFPAHVLFLTFFTNIVLLACFLGMSVGCLAAGRPRNYLSATPAFLALAVVAAYGVELLRTMDAAATVGIDPHGSPQVVFFGTEVARTDIARFVIPLEVVGGFFFVVIALAMIGPGQALGRALNRVPNRVHAYTINIVGSLVGVVLFALCSWFELSPFWWFLPVVIALGYLLYRPSGRRDVAVRWALLALVLAAVSLLTGKQTGPDGLLKEYFWSPYYRIDYYPAPSRTIAVNLIGHQQMVSRDDPGKPAYALPHLLHRDVQRLQGVPPWPFEDVLVIGAGSGNDVSRALAWGASHVDAVEIDSVIQRLGAADHPDHPYQDPRVTVHLDDGRNFLHATDRQYDLVVYALVDSLVLQSSYSNIRLESYLFTRQAFEDVRRRLKPGGLFVMYNYFRQGWVVARIQKGLEEVFGGEPLVLTLPYRERVEPEQGWAGFTLFFAGDGTQQLREAFEQRHEYWVDTHRVPDPSAADGFTQPPSEDRARLIKGLTGAEDDPWLRFGPAQVVQPADGLRAATDDWPFLYLRRPMIPDLNLRGAAVMGGLALVLLLLFAPRGRGRNWARLLDGRMFFLGAGFMLIETKAVVQMALLFGGTWMVNSVVFFAVLVMILAANLFVLTFRPQRLWPYYVALLVTLGLNAVVPLTSFLGLDRWLQVAASCSLVFVPILFAGVIFTVSFQRTAEPDRAFGANIAGAMVGGLAEYSSMLLGFQYLVLVALAFYAVSAIFRRGDRRLQLGQEQPGVEAGLAPTAAAR